MKIRAILNDGQALDLPHDTPADFGRNVDTSYSRSHVRHFCRA